MKSRFLFTLCLLAISTSFFISCSEDDTPAPVVEERTEQELTNQLVNEWVFDVMDEVYFWTSEMPDGLDQYQNPITFFDSLVFTDDRFSLIVESYDDLINSLNGVTLEAGYEFALAQSGNDEVVAIITYVKPGSPAADAALIRGDVITKVNGTTITLNNYQSLINEIFSNHSITYLRYDEGSGTYSEQPSISLDAVQFAENPIYLDTVVEIDSRKIGYLVYNFFSNGSTGDNFDSKLNAKFAEFKSAGVTDFVLDLRYNSGGSIASATKIASQLAPNVTSSDVFYRNQWNELYTEFWQNEPDGDSRLTGYFNNPENNIGTEIDGELYILTGSRTASASELLINGLDPYMNVTIIGGTTVGKNVGSIPFEDTENIENEYGILPIVIRIANADGFSEYGNGFTPLGDNNINEFNSPLAPFSSLDDPLFARAVELITGSSMGGRKSSRLHQQGFTEIGSSLDQHLRSNKAILESVLK